MAQSILLRKQKYLLFYWEWEPERKQAASYSTQSKSSWLQQVIPGLHCSAPHSLESGRPLHQPRNPLCWQHQLSGHRGTKGLTKKRHCPKVFQASSGASWPYSEMTTRPWANLSTATDIHRKHPVSWSSVPLENRALSRFWERVQ